LSRLLVVGARPGSLGDHVRAVAMDQGFEAVTAGIAGEQSRRLDVTYNYRTLRDILTELSPDHIVMTAGINLAINDVRYRFENVPQRKDWYYEHFHVNCMGPMNVLEVWLEILKARENEDKTPGHHYVAISSNSAHLARSDSAAYCASKAALSMALRVRAREISKTASHNAVVYGYEPGLLEDTPMTRDVAYWLKEKDPDRYNENRDTSIQRAPVQMHRMPGFPNNGGIDPSTLASLIIHNIKGGGAELSGCMLRIDAGEQ
jgi:NAD(P)-dependent dehydrogenase (short-subunit alcohol dehydrogenase family)